MAACKRFRDDFVDETDGFNGTGKRARISFAAVIREAMFAKSLQNFALQLEPTLRKVIQEEVDKALRKMLNSLQLPSGPAKQPVQPQGPQVIEADSPLPSPTSLPTFRLAFAKQPPQKIFTNIKIKDVDGNPLQLMLVDDSASDGHLLRSLPPSLKIELVVVNGDFPVPGKDHWTAGEFNLNVLRAREGRRPLLTGDVNNVVMRDGSVSVDDLIITDNSSWVRCGKFRIGARVAPECCDAAGVRIKEALTDRFAVKDHRGELYKKNYPPSLSDDVWRLEKIGKDGKIHRRLTEAGIVTVQDFLKLYAVDPARLRTILGQGMSDRMRESTVAHAKTCDLGTKLYFHQDPHGASVLLNPVCGVVEAVVNNTRYTAGDNFYGSDGAYIQRLVTDAYNRWGQLQELERTPPRAQDPMPIIIQQPLMLPGAMAENNPPPAIHNDIMLPSGYPQTAPSLAANASFDFDIFAETVQYEFEGAASGAAIFQYPAYQTSMLNKPVKLYSNDELSDEEEGSSVSHQGYYQPS